ncbi:hypothetical protein CASFOL_038545 [Castilleja foliolosa]|uniref:Epidermal patterning factor-like protein n=1 Tax=Castilleja foliolosa TaxID=1961234 RepID=A0ABD3BLS3_9LAMI
MRLMLCCFLVLFLHILCLVSVSSRHFGPVNGFSFFNQGTVQNQNSKTLQVITQSLSEKMEAGVNKEMKKVGSMPPSCEHKCYGCRPCDAIQVPSTTAQLGVQYTNYEPEEWMCKCGPILYSP